jgi:4-amino-4-deoxychorismate lyase
MTGVPSFLTTFWRYLLRKNRYNQYNIGVMSPSSTYLVNGRFEGGVMPMDRGLAYGDGVFRTLKLSRSQPCSWAMQYHRLESDCNALSIVCPSSEVLLDDIQRLADGAEDTSVIKVIVTRGESVRGYALPPLAQPTRIVIRTSMPQFPESYYQDGVTLHLCNIRLARQPRLAGIKHLNRLENVLARMEWTDHGIADGLLMDEGGDVIECTSANLFARFGESLVTPDLSASGVIGVTRERIMKLVPSLGYNMEVRRLRLSELMDADEVMICNSLFGLWQVRYLSSHAWPAGSLAARLHELLKEDDAVSV